MKQNSILKSGRILLVNLQHTTIYNENFNGNDPPVQIIKKRC
jgi:hypothetical protein